MRSGDMLTLTCGDGQNYGCIIEDDSMPVTLKVCYKQADNSEPNVRVTLFQGVPKGDKMEDIIQKCTELGITAVKPVLTHRSVSRPDEKSAKKKQARYSRIALEAAQQSGRGIVPEICGMESLSNAVKNDDSELKIYDYNRVVRDLNGLTKDGFLTALSDIYDIRRLAPGQKVLKEDSGALRPVRKYDVGLYLAGEAYMLSLKDEIRNQVSGDPVKSLDVSVLQDHVLSPILGIRDPRTDTRIEFIGGIRGMSELIKRADKYTEEEELSGQMSATSSDKTNTSMFKRIIPMLKSANIILLMINHITQNISMSIFPQKSQVSYLKPEESLSKLAA